MTHFYRMLLFLAIMAFAASCDGGASAYVPVTPGTPAADLPISRSAPQTGAQPTAVSGDIRSQADAEYLLLTNLYERSAVSVVNIEVIDRGTNGVIDVNTGSGFIYDTEGHIITNAHVIKDSDEVRVTFHDGVLEVAEITGTDSYSDIAVLRVETDAARLIPLPLGDSGAVRVGQRAIAIGNPFGLASSMTVGIVSGLGRQLSSAALLESALPANFQNPAIIQVDAQINPGNSGGPLLNSQGEVIGVNTAIRSSSGTFEGVGFAVPASTVSRVVPDLIAAGVVDYAWLGISAMGAEGNYSVASMAEVLNLPVDSGVLISVVTPDSPAAQAGLRGGTREVQVREQQVCVGGDIIVAINDVYVDNIDELVAYMVVNHRPGDTVSLLVVRGDQTFEVPVTLQSRPQTSTQYPCGE